MLQNNALKTISLVFIVFWDISIFRRHEGSRIKGTKNLSVLFAVRPDARGTRRHDSGRAVSFRFVYLHK